jgi:hypothetical protein
MVEYDVFLAELMAKNLVLNLEELVLGDEFFVDVT